jgi:hypothetical protein
LKFIFFSFLLVIANAWLLTQSLYSQAMLLTFYFVMIQGLVSWLFIDTVKEEVTNNPQDDIFSFQKNRVLALPEASIVDVVTKHTDSSSPEMTIDVDEDQSIHLNKKSSEHLFQTNEYIPQNFVEEAKTQSLQFLVAPDREPGQSELQYFDRITEQLSQTEGEKLVIANFHKGGFGQETSLKDMIKTNGSLEDLICPQISPHIDLIPYAGTLEPEYSALAFKYIERLRFRYQQIVFMGDEKFITAWQQLKSGPVTPEINTASDFKTVTLTTSI